MRALSSLHPTKRPRSGPWGAATKGGAQSLQHHLHHPASSNRTVSDLHATMGLQMTVLRARWRLRRQQERGGREREGRGRYCRQGTDLGCGRRGSDGSSIRSHQPIHCRATSRNVASGSSAARGRSITTASSATASSSDAHSISAGPGCSATTCHPVYRRATGRSATTGQAASCGTAGDCVALGHIGRRDAQGIHRAALGRRGH